jgi:hypothetical protein
MVSGCWIRILAGIISGKNLLSRLNDRNEEEKYRNQYIWMDDVGIRNILQ